MKYMRFLFLLLNLFANTVDEIGSALGVSDLTSVKTILKYKSRQFDKFIKLQSQNMTLKQRLEYEDNLSTDMQLAYLSIVNQKMQKKLNYYILKSFDLPSKTYSGIVYRDNKKIKSIIKKNLESNENFHIDNIASLIYSNIAVNNLQYRDIKVNNAKLSQDDNSLLTNQIFISIFKYYILQ